MSDYYCPSCDAPLSNTDINLSEGVALCPDCGKLARLGELIDYERPSEEVVNNPPSGCTLQNDNDATWIRISLRSIGILLVTLFVCLFWNGIVSVFVLIALSGLYTNLVGPLPDWAPAPTMEGGEQIPLGMTLFLCVFLTPFVTIGSIMIGAVLLSLFGVITIHIAVHAASVRTGVGPIGWTRRFDPSTVRSIRTGLSKWQVNGEHKELIEIDADRAVRFGAGLNNAKREWVIAVLRRLLPETYFLYTF